MEAEVKARSPKGPPQAAALRSASVGNTIARAVVTADSICQIKSRRLQLTAGLGARAKRR